MRVIQPRKVAETVARTHKHRRATRGAERCVSVSVQGLQETKRESKTAQRYSHTVEMSHASTRRELAPISVYECVRISKQACARSASRVVCRRIGTSVQACSAPDPGPDTRVGASAYWCETAPIRACRRCIDVSARSCSHVFCDFVCGHFQLV